MKWFRNPRTVEELKAEYKRLARENHPDLGGSTEAMQEINDEYDRLFSRLKDVHENANGDTYEAATQTAETPEAYRAIIERLVILEGIDVELCGSWIWITGNTYAVKDHLKAAGCLFSSKKKAWYWRPAEEGARRARGRYSMEQIREKFGSESIGHVARMKLA